MIDRDQLKEALEFLTARWRYDNLDSITDSRQLRTVLEAARLVADPDTLIISKVDGEWPASAEVLKKLTAMGYDGDWESAPPAEEAIRDILDALLERQPK